MKRIILVALMLIVMGIIGKEIVNVFTNLYDFGIITDHQTKFLCFKKVCQELMNRKTFQLATLGFLIVVYLLLKGRFLKKIRKLLF